MNQKVAAFRGTVAFALSLALISCAGAPITVTTPRSTPAPTAPAAAPAPAAAAAPATAPVPAPTATQPAPPADYLPPGHAIVGFHLQPFEATLYDIPFVVAEVIDPTDRPGTMLVEPVIRVPGYNEPATEFFSSHIYQSSVPAKLELLSVGSFVFVAFDADPRTDADLARNGHWQLAKVKDLSKIAAGIVVVEFHNSYHNEWRTREYHIRNTRVLTEPIAELSLAGLEPTRPLAR